MSEFDTRKLGDLVSSGKVLSEESRAIAAEFGSRIKTPSASVTSITFGVDGLMKSVTFDRRGMSRLSAEEVIADLNTALQAQSQIPSSTTVDATHEEILAKLNQINAALESSLKDLKTLRDQDSTPFFNEERTVTVMAKNGVVTSIDCRKGWLHSTPVETVENEIVQTARAAAISTNPISRFTP